MYKTDQINATATGCVILMTVTNPYRALSALQGLCKALNPLKQELTPTLLGKHLRQRGYAACPGARRLNPGSLAS
jgi:hypothetical protein